MSYDDDGGMLRLPSPHDPNSGYVAPRYAIGSAPAPAPEGMVFVPGLNTYVDHDIAAQLGLSGPATGTQGAPDSASPTLNPLALADELGEEVLNPEELEISDEELEALTDELEAQSDRSPSLSPTLDDIADHFGGAFDAAVDLLVGGTAEDTLELLSEATGLDTQTAATLIETTVMEAEPVASEHIGSDRWASIVYAAAATPDPLAKRIVAEFIQGNIEPSKLMDAYAYWYDRLPDGED
ncbi:hypothetical protein [Mesorhizobium sp. YM1C-6-2]|uniref:hypothetical protein n=1 Tax=Mesorhizobium sp. YM1C-6-2 TaxID=1827501 RepID=UPI000EF27F31|nr:hypothetical protein [Mesorhizobium sp. YM1C-6-2]RLP23897.1 hypothetical protein D8676_17820 [Mesorhizobium sp. YM1C-6-2]